MSPVFFPMICFAPFLIEQNIGYQTAHIFDKKPPKYNKVPLNSCYIFLLKFASLIIDRRRHIVSLVIDQLFQPLKRSLR